jgi:hypothetical protein
MQILKETGIDWRERRLISNLYMAQSVKVRLNRGETRSVKIGRGVRQGCCLSPILFKLYSECLNNDALEEFGDFKRGGKIIHTLHQVKHKEYLLGPIPMAARSETETCTRLPAGIVGSNLTGDMGIYQL